MDPKKAKEIVLAIPRIELFGESDRDAFQGFMPHKGGIDYLARIIEDHVWMPRGELEENPDYKHIIPYEAVVQPVGNLIFSYLRSKDHIEARLAGQWSIGVGGHIRYDDRIGDDIREQIRQSRKRERGEEIVFDGKTYRRITPQELLLGYVNDDTQGEGESEVPVGAVHLGLLRVIVTNRSIVNPNEKEIEMAEGRLRSPSEIGEMFRDANPIEGWTEIALPHVEEFLKNYQQ